MNTIKDYLGYKCEHKSCHKIYPTKTCLMRHQLSHANKKRRCPYCFKSFLRSKDLADHAFVHSDGKSFVCNHEGCNKSYTRVKALITHMKKHNIIDLSEDSSDESISIEFMNCTTATIESVFTQIQSLEFPSFFNSRELPVPPSFGKITPSPFIPLLPTWTYDTSLEYYK